MYLSISIMPLELNHLLNFQFATINNTNMAALRTSVMEETLAPFNRNVVW